MLIRISPTNSFLEDPPRWFLAYNTHFPWQCRPGALLDPISNCHRLFLAGRRLPALQPSCPADRLLLCHPHQLPGETADLQAGKWDHILSIYSKQPCLPSRPSSDGPHYSSVCRMLCGRSSPQVLTNSSRDEQWEPCSGSLLDGVEQTLEILTPELRLCCALEPLG